MTPTDDHRGNKFGFALRQLERRVRALEAHVGLASPPNPLRDPTTDRRERREETTRGIGTDRR